MVEDLRVEHVLTPLDSLLQGLLIVIGQYLDLPLREDRARVHTLVDQMHRAPGHPYPGCENVPVRVGAREVWQQRGVDVDQPTLPTRDEPRREDAHVAAQYNEFSVRSNEFGVYQMLVREAPFGLVDLHRKWHADVLHTGITSMFQAPCIGAVRESEHGGVAAWSLLISEQRGEAGAAAGDQHCESDWVFDGACSGKQELRTHAKGEAGLGLMFGP